MRSHGAAPAPFLDSTARPHLPAELQQLSVRTARPGTKAILSARMTETTYRGVATKLPTQRSNPAGERTLKRRVRRVRRAVYGMFYRLAYRVLPILPEWTLRVFGRIVIVPVARLMYGRLADTNLSTVYPTELSHAERKRVRNDMFRGLSSFFVEIIGVFRQGQKYFAGRIDDTSARQMVAKLEAQSQKGWIGATPHMGNWVLLATWASSLPGTRGLCHAIAKRQPNPHLSDVLDDVQKRMEFAPIYTNSGPMTVVAACLKLLRSGGRLGIAPDQDSSKAPGVFLDFLGHRAYTTIGAAQMALSADVPIVPLAFIRKNGGQGFEILHGEPIHPDHSRTRKQETIRLTRACNEAMEAMIHAHKDQWIWFHRRWQTTPSALAGREMV